MAEVMLAGESNRPRVHAPQRPTVKTAIAGVSGYVGGELARLLLGHPRLRSEAPLLLGRSEDTGVVQLGHLHPHLASAYDAPSPDIYPFSWNMIAEAAVAVVFLALPHEASRKMVPLYLERGIRVIDLSGAWRLRNQTNSAVYGLRDADPLLGESIQSESVYGCPELHRSRIASARLVANPGCYATSIILALAPLVAAGIIDLDHGIVCDAKSGVSGVGKAPSATTHFMNIADNMSAYKVFGHRHTGELLEQLHLTDEQIQFTPHLLPIPRGILSTIYLRLSSTTKAETLEELFRRFYCLSPMVRIYRSPDLPQIPTRNPYKCLCYWV